METDRHLCEGLCTAGTGMGRFDNLATPKGAASPFQNLLLILWAAASDPKPKLADARRETKWGCGAAVRG